MPKFELLPFQAEFFLSEKKFPAFVGGIATGKTLTLLLKIWRACERYPGIRALIVRKEYTDLRDSTIADFERYFGVKINRAEKSFAFSNGSEILFRHGGELNVLKNLNLGIVGIEQAEEFEDATAFDFLRDRLRQKVRGLKTRQLCIIANPNGHNWIWERWKANPPSDEYHLVHATTWDNEGNLPEDFLEDLKRMETEAPLHYKRYVLASWDDFEADDVLFTSDDIRQAIEREVGGRSLYRVMAIDPAWAEDEFAYAIVDWYGYRYQCKVVDGWDHTDLMVSTGKVLSLMQEWKPDLVVVDEVGVGAGVLARIREVAKVDIVGFNSVRKDQMRHPDRYKDLRAEAYFTLKDNFHLLKIPVDDTLAGQLATIRFYYLSDGRKAIISKHEILKRARKEGRRFHSPDRADALAMAFYYAYREGKRLYDPWEMVGPFAQPKVEIGATELLKH